MRVLDGNGRVAQRRTRRIDMRAVASLVGATAGTGKPLENETAVGVADRRDIGVAGYILVECIDGILDTIDIDIHIAKFIRRKRIGIGAGMGFVVVGCFAETEIKDRLYGTLKLGRRGVGSYLHFAFLIFVLGDGYQGARYFSGCSSEQIVDPIEGNRQPALHRQAGAVLVRLAVGNRRCSGNRIGLVGLVAVDGLHLLLLVDVDKLHPLANHIVVGCNLIAGALHIRIYRIYPCVTLYTIISVRGWI